MEPGPDTLRKVLTQERALGFQDKAMIGGLDAFLERWRETKPEGLTIPESYKGMGVQERRQWIEGALATLERAPATIEKKVDAKPVSKPRPSNKAPSKPKPAPKEDSPDLDSPVTALKGVQDATAKRLAKLGVATVRDLIYLFPNRHMDFRATNPIAELTPGEDQTATGSIWEASVVRLGPRRQGSEAILGDDTGNIKIVWFGNTYIGHSLKPNQHLAVSGRVRVFRGQKVFENPEYEVLSDKASTHTGRLVPVYPLTDGLYQRPTRNLVRRTLELCIGKVSEFLDAGLIRRRELMPIKQAIARAHYPEDEDVKEKARVRLAFNELLLMQLRVLARKREWQLGQEARPIDTDEEPGEAFRRIVAVSVDGGAESGVGGGVGGHGRVEADGAAATGGCREREDGGSDGGAVAGGGQRSARGDHGADGDSGGAALPNHISALRKRARLPVGERGGA